MQKCDGKTLDKCQYAVGKADKDYDLFDAEKYFAQGLTQDLLLTKFLCGSNEIHNIHQRKSFMI